MKRRFNVRLVCILFLATVLFSVAVHFVHAYQIKRNAGTLLYQADRARQDGNLDHAADYLARYLAYMPGDTAALKEYGLILADDKMARTPRARLRALEVLEQVLRREPGDHDTRRRLVPLAMDLERFSEAREKLEVLLQASPTDADLEYLLGRCEEADGQYEKAANLYLKAIEHGKRGTGVTPVAPVYVIRSYIRRAALLRQQLERPADADKTVDELIQLAPDNAEVILAAADRAIAKGNTDEARKHLERGIEKHPKNVNIYLALAGLEVQAGRPQQALASLRTALKEAGEHPDALFSMAELLLNAGEKEEARELIARLERGGVPEAPVSYLRARVALAESKWLEAARRLESARPLLVRSPELTKKTDLFLAECYERLGNPDLQLSVCRRALGIDPNWAPARLALASALSKMGRLDEALVEYRKVPTAPAAAALAVARLLILKNLRLSPAERRWNEVEELLAQLDKVLPDSVDAAILRAEVLVAKDKPGEAQKLLEAIRTKNPKELAPWTSLASLLNRQGDSTQALKLLDQARQQLGDSAELRLAHASHWIYRNRKEAAKALIELEKDSDKLSSEDRLQLQRGLADAYARAGAVIEARRLWKEVAEQQPNELQVLFLLFDLALQANDQEELKDLLKEMKRIEGEGGTAWRYGEAARVVAVARKGSSQQPLDEARKLLGDVARRRPSWSRVPLLRAEISELEANREQALDEYLEAVKLGESRPGVIRRTAQLLYERRRFAEADEVIRRLPSPAPISGELGRLAADIALRNRDPKRALELAQSVATKSTDYRDHIWLGQIYWAVGQRKEAEVALRDAVKLAQNVPDPWVASVFYLAGTEQKERAEEVIREAQQKLPPAEAPLGLAQCYEAVGRRDKAEEQYQIALKGKPDDLLVLRNASHFYIRTFQPGKAMPHLRRIIAPELKAPKDVVLWARRSLAAVLVTQSDDRFNEALALVEENLKMSGGAVEDLRAKAVVFAVKPSRRREAIDLFERLAERQTPPPEETFLLVQLYDAEKDWNKLRERMLSLLASHGDNPRYLSYYTRKLIERKEEDQAAVWLARLEKLEPNAPRTVELKVRTLKAQDRAVEATGLLRTYAQSKEANAGLVAGLLEELGEAADAEKMYRRFATESKRPESVLILAQHLGRQRRVAEALDFCERAWENCAPEAVAASCVSILRASQAGEHASRVEQQFLTAIKKKPDSTALHISLADLHDFQGRHADAETIYRQLLERDKRNVVALNNLAWLLAFQDGKGSEALDLVNRAVEIVGPAPELLDTRGVVYMRTGQAAQAIKDLRDVVTRAPSASRQYHLAHAYHLAGDRDGAVQALAKAKVAGLQENSLHPLEQKNYSAVVTAVECK